MQRVTASQPFDERNTKISTRLSAASTCADEEVPKDKELSDDYSEEMQKKMGTTVKCALILVMVIAKLDICTDSVHIYMLNGGIAHPLQWGEKAKHACNLLTGTAMKMG